MTEPIELNIGVKYKPREAFRAYHANEKRLAVTVAHRRAGKTVARINRLIKAAVMCELPNPRFGYIAPFYVQAKDIAWQYLKHYCSPILENGGKSNEAELSITMPHNNAVIRLYGAENAERMRGLYFDGIVPDEAQGMKKSTLTAIIMPALADRKGWLDVSGTPRGWDNLLGELVKLSANDESWFRQILRASETGIIDAEELARLKKLMPENEYAQEFECDFDAAITGSVYGKWMAEAEVSGRVRSALFDRELKVHTAWDLGFSDATAIWFWQVAGSEVRFIDCYENTGEGIEHYVKVLRERGYEYGEHYVPHDAANKLLAAGGRSIVHQAFALGVKMKVVPATSQMNGIEALRKVLEKAWFDTDKCADGLAALKQYQFEFDESKQVFRDKPKHDWTSHFADACEIVGQVLQEPVKSEPVKRPKFLAQATANEIFGLDNWKPKPKYERI